MLRAQQLEPRRRYFPAMGRLGILLLLVVGWQGASAANHTFSLERNRFVKDGEPIRLLSGRWR